MKKNLLIIFISICTFFSCYTSVNAADNPKVTCTYTIEDSLSGIKNVMVIKRYTTGTNGFFTRAWGATMHYKTIDPDGTPTCAATDEFKGHWHGTWDAFSEKYECPKYLAWKAKANYSSGLNCSVGDVHAANSEEQLKDLSGYAIVIEDSYKQQLKEEEEKICEGRNLANGTGTRRDLGITDVSVYYGLEHWYEVMETMDSNNCFDYDVKSATMQEWSQWKKLCESAYHDFVGDKNSYGEAKNSSVPQIKDAISYMKELGCVKDTDVIYNGDTLSESQAKIEQYYQKAMENSWKLDYKYEQLMDEYNCQIEGNCKEEESDNSYTGGYYCGIFGEGTWKYIQNIYTIIKILIPALVIVLGMVDFMKVVFSGEEKDMKTAGQRFLKRIIAGIIFILLPVLLQFMMKLFGFSENCLQELIWILR